MYIKHNDSWIIKSIIDCISECMSLATNVADISSQKYLIISFDFSDQKWAFFLQEFLVVTY